MQPQRELDTHRGQLQLFQPGASRSHWTVASQPSSPQGWCWKWLSPRNWSCVWPSSWLCPITTGSQSACTQLLPGCCWSEEKAAGRGFSPCGFPGKGGSSSKDKAASRSLSWGCAQCSGSQGRAQGAGGTAGRDSGEEAEPESCVALSAADVYCTGWAEWEGGCLEWGPVPPAARPQGAGAGTGPALAVHSVWKAPECEAARHTCTHTHPHTCTRTHTRTHTQHTHRHLVHSVGAFPSPRARAPAPASVLALPTGTWGRAHPQPRSGGQCVRGCLQASG